MDIKEILSENYFIFLDNPSSKKSAFEQLSRLAEIETNISSRVILENLIKREKLGSTAVGKGVAIPHITNDDIEKPIGFMALLSTGLDFNATDNQLVDIIFLLNDTPKHTRPSGLFSEPPGPAIPVILTETVELVIF